MNIVEAKGLCKKYGDFSAVDDLSFSVKKGEMVGFLGVNGAGKSTTINMMSSLIKPTSGSLLVCGADVQKNSGKVREKIGIVFQNNTLDDLLTVWENLTCRAVLYGEGRKSVKKKSKELLSAFQLEAILKKKYGKLSGGQKRKCEIAAALMHTPELLILDEPTTGLDPASRQEVWKIIDELRRRTGLTVFLTTHYMEEAARADRIIILDRGKIKAEGRTHELKEKYAHDRLKIYFSQDLKSGLPEKLSGRGCKFEAGCISLQVTSSDEALEILEDIRGQYESFEFVHGTLDDVFLNCTQEEG